MTPPDDVRNALAQARREYLRDMKWLRRRFGMVPEPSLSLVNPAFLAALDALESNDPAKIKSATSAFHKLHRSLMKESVWSMLEQTKKTLRALQETEPVLYCEKIALWNQASWVYTNFGARKSRSLAGNYRKALDILSRL